MARGITGSQHPPIPLISLQYCVRLSPMVISSEGKHMQMPKADRDADTT
jgi:hypothetical protein